MEEPYADMKIDFSSMARNALVIWGICAFISCGERVDNSSPVSVAKYYYSQSSSGNLEEAYEVIADTCKAMVTFDEYVNHFHEHDSASKQFSKVWYANFVAQPPILDDLEHRRFEVQRFAVSLDKKDTLRQVFYCTLLNEAGNWKVVWVDNIYSIAESLRERGEIEESNTTLRKTLEFDPYYSAALIHLGWSDYFEFNNYGNASLGGSDKHNPNLVENQILLAYIYCAEGEINRAEQYFKSALELQEKLGRKGISEYLHRFHHPKTHNPYFQYSSEILLRELKDDWTDATKWFWGFKFDLDISQSRGDLRSSENSELRNELRELLAYYTQKRAYAILARCELERYIEQSQKEPFKYRKLDFLLLEAQEHIEFALEIEPDNDSYLHLLERIKQQIKSLEK